MAYNSTIPQPTDQINNSQPQLLGNFQAIDTLVNVNHVDFDDPDGDQGKHKWVAYPTQDYTPPINPGEVTLYAPISGVTSVRELSVINQLGVTTPITASNLSFTPTPPMNSSGWSYFASGIKVVFATTTTISVVGVNTLTLSNLLGPSFTFPNQILRGIVGVYNPAGTALGNNVQVSWVTALNNDQFQVYVSAACRLSCIIFGY